MSTESTELEQARAAAQAILGRVKSDDAYVRRLREEPALTLLEAGMPPALLGAALAELGASEQEVEGYLRTVPSAAVSRPVGVPHAVDALIWRPRDTASSGGEILRRLGWL